MLAFNITVDSLYITFSEDFSYWIGASDIDKEGEFVWLTGAPVAWGDWWPNEPNNGRGGPVEDCVHDQSRSNQYAWNDAPCNNYNCHFICEGK